MEIERRFLVLVDDLPEDLNLEKYRCKEISQDYLYIDDLTTIRKRKIIQDNTIKYFYTIKTDKRNISINELEKEIDGNTYYNLATDTRYNTIIKKRYIIPYKNGLEIELDLFEGIYKGLCFGEIEFENEEQAYNTELPEWFGKDISTSITNADLAKSTTNQILNILLKR